MTDLDLPDLVSDFGAGLKAADALRPQAKSFRSGRVYQPGIGPHGENAAVELTLGQMRERRLEAYQVARPIAYPGSRHRCDLGIGEPLVWAVEVKMARAYGDNGRLDDTYLKDLLSPYPADHSVVGDAVRLAESGFTSRKAVLVYGFDYPDRPLDLAIEALELLMSSRVLLGPRASSAFEGLVHPVQAQGRVVAWEILGRSA